jgi:hypothetical protein
VRSSSKLQLRVNEHANPWAMFVCETDVHPVDGRRYLLGVELVQRKTLFSDQQLLEGRRTQEDVFCIVFDPRGLYADYIWMGPAGRVHPLGALLRRAPANGRFYPAVFTCFSAMLIWRAGPILLI